MWYVYVDFMYVYIYIYKYVGFIYIRESFIRGGSENGKKKKNKPKT